MKNKIMTLMVCVIILLFCLSGLSFATKNVDLINVNATSTIEKEYLKIKVSRFNLMHWIECSLYSHLESGNRDRNTGREQRM